MFRLDGEFKTPAGPAVSDCEKREWLVVAPTRAAVFDRSGHTQNRDGVGLYRVGSTSPESIPARTDDFPGESARFAEHARAVRLHDTKRWVSAGLGISGLLALAAGTALFVTAFHTHQGKSEMDHTQAIWGGVLGGLGFGLGISGTVLNPSQAERSRADAARYTFQPPIDTREDVQALTARYNERVRARCTQPTRP